MMTHARPLMATLLALVLLLGTAPRARAATSPSEGQAQAIGRTPPRLSYINGEVSLLRPGAQDWSPAQANTPLAPGDELYTSTQGDLEMQVGTRAFVRAWGDTQLGLANQEPDFLQFRVTNGHVSLDLRSLDPGRTVELDTPHAAFTIDHPGYYRADVTQERTSFITRRAGQATMTSAVGQAVAIAPTEEVVLQGTPTPTVQSYVAPELDTWDQWNYARTDHLLEAVSARYVPSDVYGVDDLDQHGSWRVVQAYGPVWVPETIPAGWVPYSTGRWIWDPYYGWTWVDVAPWGWAPYHYGRWVFVDGWGGPRVVNNVVINRTTVVNVNNITVYRNVTVQNAVVAVRQEHFGARPIQEARINQVDVHRLEPVRGPLRVAPSASSFVAASAHAARPPEAMAARPVVATRPLAGRPLEQRREVQRTAPVVSTPAPRIVSAPNPARTTPVLSRPPFGSSQVERPRRPLPPRLETTQRPEATAAVRGSAGRPEAQPPAQRERVERPQPTPPVEQRGPASSVAQPRSDGNASAPAAGRSEAPRPSMRPLPGEPANRLFPGRAEAGPRQEPGSAGGQHAGPGPASSRERGQR